MDRNANDINSNSPLKKMTTHKVIIRISIINTTENIRGVGGIISIKI